MKEYTVNIETSEQVTEDTWATVAHNLKITENTTIGEIEKWYKSYILYGYTRFTIIELEAIIPELPF